MRLLLLLLWPMAALGQPQQNPDDLLRMVRRKVVETLARMPRYTCTQTIDRFEYEPEKRERPACPELITQLAIGKWKPRLQTSDRLRLEVAVGGGREMYSWVGENRFEDRGLTELIRGGAISTGTFTTFLSAIFSGNAATFRYLGAVKEKGRELAQFEFRVPAEKSRYTFRGQGEAVFTAFGGTFQADAKTADVVMLIVQTAELPASSGACQATTSMQYTRIQMNAADFLLPKEVRLQILDRDGSQNVNRTVFSDCHEFVGQSTLRFDGADMESSASGKGPGSPEFSLRPGMWFKTTLTQEIDTGAIAAGDRVKARLVETLRDHGTVLVRSGAPVNLRVLEIRHYYGSRAAVVVNLKIESVQVGSETHALPAKVVVVPRPRGVPREYAGTAAGINDADSAAMTFFNVGPNYVIRRGLDLDWVTK